MLTQGEAQASLSTTNDMLDGVISGTTSNSFHPVTAGPNGVTMMIAPGQQGQVMPTADVPSLVSDDPWRMFAAGRYSHVTGTDAGDQFNGLFGVSHRFAESSALGLFGGFETFNYASATPARLNGQGGTVGAFLAGSLTDRLKLDGRVYGSLLNYNIAAGGATGSLTAQRLGTSVTASYELAGGPLSLTPFVRGSGLFEWQSAYTDSAAVAHGAQAFSVGLIAPGLRIAHRSTLSNGVFFTPYLAGEADYAFGNGVLPGFNDTQGLAGKVSAGLNWTTQRGLSLGVDCSYGGIGSSIQSENIQAALSVPF